MLISNGLVIAVCWSDLSSVHLCVPMLAVVCCEHDSGWQHAELCRGCLLPKSKHCLCCGLDADSVKVMATLMVVGVMDAARDDILGDGNISLSLVETLSQVQVFAESVPWRVH